MVTQEPSLTVSPGGTVTLTCASSTGAVANSNYPHWIQQKSGQVPRTLIYNTNGKPSGTPARFSGSILGDKAALTLSGAQPEDEAEYYCALWHSDHPHCDTCRGEVRHKPRAQGTLCFCLPRSCSQRLVEGVRAQEVSSPRPQGCNRTHISKP